MKTNLLLLLIMIVPFSIKAQKTVWAKPLTHDITLVSDLHKVCTDSDDNFYVMANFARKISFGTIELKSGSKSPDINDAFIAKIDPYGEKIFWGLQITGQGNIEGKGLTTDSENNVYVTGSFEGETTFGTTTISPKHKYGFFIAKYNADGDFQWVRSGGNYESKWSVATAFGYDIETDKNGNVYVAANVLGMYDDWTDDPSLPVEKRYLGKAYFEDQIIEGDEFYTGNHTVLIKLSPDGKFIWKRVGALNLGLRDLAIDDDENIYMTGAIGGTSVFEGKKLEANGLSDIIVIKFNSDGKTAWIKQFGVGKPYSSGAYAKKAASDIEGGQFIGIDAAGNVYFTGVHFNGAKFDDKTLASDAKIKGMEVGNAFLAKLDKDGNIKWIKNAEGKGTANLSGMVCDKAGNVYLSGRIFLKKVTFDGKKAKGAFVMKFNSDGETQWIDDADTREKSWGTKVTVRVTYISDIAINKSENYLYTTGNAVKETVETSHGITTTTTTTTTETLIAISKIKTD
ncbi:SBBP repeat-containing protein [candidate division KSB1 bacterium]